MADAPVKLLRCHLPGVGPAWGVVDGADVSVIAADTGTGGAFLASLLQLPNPARALRTGDAAGRLARLPLDALLTARPDDARAHLLAPARSPGGVGGRRHLRAQPGRAHGRD